MVYSSRVVVSLTVSGVGRSFELGWGGGGGAAVHESHYI